MPSRYTATDAEAYQQLMGRWSPALAHELIGWAAIRSGDRVLDLGCGTGGLALELAARPEPAAIVGIDIAAPYIAYAASRSTDPRLSFLIGDAVALDLPDHSFDRAFSLLALNFMSDPLRALTGMSRVTRIGGVVAAAVWDFPGGLVYQRIFWDTAAALDPAADRARARHYSSPLTGPRRTRRRICRRRSRPDRKRVADNTHAISRIRRLLGADCERSGAPRRLCQRIVAGPTHGARFDRAACISSGGARRPAFDGSNCLGRARRCSRDEIGRSRMKLSARNQLKRRVLEIRKGATTSHVRIDIGNGVVITSSITNEAVDDLGLATGDEAFAVVKASDVMVAK